jgi:hypothetical protein
MSAALEARARDKELLLARSALCRLRLRSQSSALRDALGWRDMAVSAAASPGARGALLAIALSLPVLARTARFAVTAIRAVLLARLALSLIRHVQALGRAPPAPR